MISADFRYKFIATPTIVLAMIFGMNPMARAQTVDINDVDSKSLKDSTTIEIRKGEKAAAKQTLWQILEETADIEGEHTPTKKEARVEWKKACDNWKKEVKENKEVISHNCGKPACISETEGFSCKSQAKFKIKTQTAVTE